MYALRISHGALTIRPAIYSGCELWLDDVCIRECGSANEAARLVAMRQTGHEAIDNEDCTFPADIDGWHWVSVFQAQELSRELSRPTVN